MKTKKDFLKWWELGYNAPSDLMSFYNGVDNSLTYTEEISERNPECRTITVNSKKWRRPLYLGFHKQECIRITNF